MYTQYYKFMDMSDEELLAIQRKATFSNDNHQAATAELESRARRRMEALAEAGHKREEQMLSIAKSTRWIALASLLVSGAAFVAAFIG